mmetsp:Transcript_36902/g.50861  ORF Transcript_36902/g.50861 Transcript_36902/m.50861 type:complete len:249 (-) Transcript_36902:70-816(-)
MSEPPVEEVEKIDLPKGWYQICLPNSPSIYFRTRGQLVSHEPPSLKKKSGSSKKKIKEKNGKKKEEVGEEEVGEEETDEETDDEDDKGEKGGQENGGKEGKEGENDEDQALIKCRACRKENRSDFNFCGKCGTGLKGGKKKGGCFSGFGVGSDPIMYTDYGIGFDDCDHFNMDFSRHQWPYRRSGTRSMTKGKSFSGYELKIDDFYFTGMLLNSYALFQSQNNHHDSSFSCFCDHLASEIVCWLKTIK